MVMTHVICGGHGGCERTCALTATTIPPQDGAALQILRTPDKSFADLPDYPFQPHYVDVANGVGGRPLRVHYIDEGPTDAPAVLMMHGEPSWSYLYRKMVPVLTGAGLRAVAIDLVGFGRSDKPTERGDYTLARHVEGM